MATFVLPFEKMHGIGNDFIMLERRHMPQDINDQSLAKILCNRNFGIGADGIIILEPLPVKGADFAWSYYNSDGSQAEMCGNGMRCFAKYVYERGFTDEVSFTVLTNAGIIKPSIDADGSVTVDMGIPILPSLPRKEIKINSKTFEYTYIEIGNPHCVIFLDNEVSDSLFFEVGPKIEKAQSFPNGINVEFANVLNRSQIKCRVWERGAGPTLACGTGACAVLLAASIKNLTDDKAVIYLPGGPLNIKWDRQLGHVYLNGTAMFVYTGQFALQSELVKKSVVS